MMALSTPSYVISPVSNPNPNPNSISNRHSNRRGLPCSSFLPPGLHSSGSSPFAGDGFESLALQRWGRLQKSKPISQSRHGSVTVKALFGLGMPELVVIAGVAALIFGPKKLPEIGKSLGKTVKSFQQAAKEFESEVKQGGDSADSSKPEVLSASAVPEKEKENTEV